MSHRKQERLNTFLERLSTAPPAVTAEEAFVSLSSILNAVEDELTSIPFNPMQWEHDERMYPPLPDNAHSVPGRPDLTRYRSRKHNIWIAANGAIRIAALNGDLLLDKAGKDGKKVELP